MKKHLSDEDLEWVVYLTPRERAAIRPPPADERSDEGLLGVLHHPDVTTSVISVTDNERAIADGRDMNVLVTITVLDDEGEEIDSVSASAETPAEAYELAFGQLELDNAAE